MKVASKIFTGFIMCAGLLQTASAKKIKVNKPDSIEELFYAVETKENPGSLTYKKVSKGAVEVNLKKAKKIYFRTSEETTGKPLTIPMSLDNSQIIIINESGMPRYGTQAEVDFFSQNNQSRPKSRL